jgi:hypothetical protein
MGRSQGEVAQYLDIEASNCLPATSSSEAMRQEMSTQWLVARGFGQVWRIDLLERDRAFDLVVARSCEGGLPRPDRELASSTPQAASPHPPYVHHTYHWQQIYMEFNTIAYLPE